MLSRARMGVPHVGHAEPGRTIDSLRGTRWITTVRNDPKARPATAKRITANRVTPESLRFSLRRPPAPDQSPSRGRGDDLSQIRGLRVVALEEVARDQDRHVVHTHLVVDVYLTADDLAVEPVGVVVREVHRARAVHEHVQVVEARVVRDVDVLVAGRA